MVSQICSARDHTILKPKQFIAEPKEGWANYFGGCSWYCGAPKIHVSASSFLSEEKNINYTAQSAHDGKINTVWCEGVKGQGIGEKITFVFDTKKKDVAELGVTSITIANGHQASQKLFRNNSRAKELLLIVDGNEKAKLELEDKMGLQKFEIPKLNLPRPSKHSISLQILSVYAGDKFEDTCISEISFSGTGNMH